MDRNPNHFPTLMFICAIMSSLLYVIANVVYFIHQRKKVQNLQALAIDNANMNAKGLNDEEQQVTKCLKDQENE